MSVKILECIRQGQVGGGESHLLSLVENLDRSRFEPVVLSFTDGPMINRLNEMNVKTHVIHTVKPFDISKWKQVKQFIKEQDVQLVHAHGTRAISNTFNACSALKLPLVYTVHGWSFHDDQNPIVKKVRILGEKLLTSRADVNISVSESNRLTGVKNFSSFRSEVVNNGIDQKRFDPLLTRKDIRNELGIGTDKKIVLFIARFTAHKQPLVLLKAFAEAAGKDGSLVLLMVGDGDQKAEALKMVSELNISDKVIFESFRQDVPDVLAAADIFVLPSLWEGLPIGLLEAMSMGKAIIASNVDGTREVVENNENGILIEVKDLQKDLPSAILKLAGDKELTQRLRTNAIATVRNRFNANSMTRKIEEIYDRLLNNNYPGNK